VQNYNTNRNILQALRKYNNESTQKSLSGHSGEPGRFINLSLVTGELLLDFPGPEWLKSRSANCLSCGIEDGRKRRFTGEDVNYTE